MTVRTPNEVLRKRGTTGSKGRLSPVKSPTDGVQKLARANPARAPKPPRDLGPAGRELWRRIWRSGCDWVSPQSDLERVLSLCEMVDEYVSLRKRAMAPMLMDEALPLAGAEKRTYDALRDLRKQYGDALMQLGFTPAGRANLNVGEVPPADPLEDFREEAV
jgi:P27 family predicted phage terminase small subunit